MTTGDPLVVRGAMKPIPTLTSRCARWTSHEGAGAGAARAHRHLHRAGRRRRGRGDGGAGARARLPREVRRRPHRRRRRGARRLPGAHRLEAVAAGPRRRRARPGGEAWRARVRRLHGRGQVERRPRGGGRARREPLDADRELERELGEPIEAFFDREGEHEFRRREEELVLRLLGRAGRRRGGPRRRRAAVGRACATRSRRHTVVLHRGRAPTTRGGARPARAARSRATAPRFDELHADRRATYEAVADAHPAAGTDRGSSGRALAGAAAPARRRRPARLVWARGESGEYPVFVGRGLLASGFFHPRARAGASSSPTRTSRALHIGCRRRSAATRSRPGESEKTLARAEACCAAWRAPGSTRDDLVVAVGGGVVGDLAASAPPSTSAASASCRCRHAGRAGRLRLRRQDRRRPAGGEELRRRLPPAGARAGRPRAARHAAARRSARRATPRS